MTMIKNGSIKELNVNFLFHKLCIQFLNI